MWYKVKRLQDGPASVHRPDVSDLYYFLLLPHIWKIWVIVTHVYNTYLLLLVPESVSVTYRKRHVSFITSNPQFRSCLAGAFFMPLCEIGNISLTSFGGTRVPKIT